MSYPDVLHITEAVEKIFDLYNECHPDPAQFSVTPSSPLLLTIDVFKALLHHAIAPSSVAKNFWQFLEPFFNDVLKENGDPTNPRSLVLGPPKGEWTLVENKLLELSDGDELTEAMNHHAREWMTGLLLPIRSRGRTPGTLQSGDSLHKRVGRFRRQILERENYICPVTLLKDKDGFEKNERGPRLTLEAAHILPFAIGNTQSLVWKYIEMFTGDTKIQENLYDINVVENGILLQHDVHVAFGNLMWGIETKTENGNVRYFIKTFGEVFFYPKEVGTGTELHFSSDSGHNPPNPDVCALHLAVCKVAAACGAAEIFDKLFEHDPDIIGPVSDQYTLPTVPALDDIVVPYFERRLVEESILVPLLQIS